MNPEELERSVRFVSEHLADILDGCPGSDSPQRRDLIARVASLLVGRYYLHEPALFWEELSHSPFGLCAALDALDTLEHCGLQVVQRRRGYGDDARALMRGLEQAIDELRSDCIRMARESGPTVLVDAGALERVAVPMFVLSAGRSAAALNAAGRTWQAGRGGERCYQVFFAAASDCPGCQLDAALCGAAPARCSARLADGRAVDLARLTPMSVLAHFGAPAGNAARAEPMRAGEGQGDQVGAGLLEHIGSGIMFVDRSERIAFANGFARELLGDALVGASLTEVLPGARMPRDERQHTLRVTLGGKEVTLGYRCVTGVLDGTPGWVVSVRDITEIERLRVEMDQMRRLSEIGRMCAVVAHEIRNPLAGIMATIQSIEEDARGVGLGQPLEQVQQEVNRLSELLTGFFAFVRHRPPRRRATDVAALIRQATSSAAPRLAGATCQTDIAVGRKVWVDPDQLHQVLLNLIINAADAVDGRGTVRVRARVEVDQLAIDVIDDGCGIPRDRLGQVFDAFYTTKPGGTGLGLSICYRVINAHGGAIRIDSAHGIGTRVQLTIPALEPP